MIRDCAELANTVGRYPAVGTESASIDLRGHSEISAEWRSCPGRERRIDFWVPKMQTTLVKFGPAPRPPGTERLDEALTAVEQTADLSNALLGRIKGAFNRACVAYAEGHVEIASCELMTLALWLEQALDNAGEGGGQNASAVWKADHATVRLRRAWRKEWQRRHVAALVLSGEV